MFWKNGSKRKYMKRWGVKRMFMYLFLPPEVFCTKKVFLEISKNSWENNCVRDSFNKVAGLVNFANFLRTPFLQNTSGRLLLHLDSTISRILNHNTRLKSEKP